MRVLCCLLLCFLPVKFCFAQSKTAENKISVHFSFDSFVIAPEELEKLDHLFTNERPEKILVVAHCDSFGTNAYNDLLAKRRAESVQKYLTQHFPAITAVETDSKGKRFPLNNNSNASERALNRRAEISWEIKKAEPEVQMKDSISSSRKSSVENLFNDKDTSAASIEGIEIGTTIRLQNLNFQGGRHVLLPSSYKTLEKLLNTLKSNPGLEVLIAGHVCCVSHGDGVDVDTDTNDLSVRRAKEIYDYLVIHGIDPVRLTYKGFGSNHKLVDEITEEDRSTNRRVEIIILKK
ncbi:MAG TPA: OmpA family protein [Bacteroidia bacterium]|nr:OmpA family protein [Bacteroidia bacterium]